ncbi:hypothetical protein M1349_00705 [Patescibacteria group bacterium]|nr:hypothetical protein [Patescibacteria group bacterium]
MYLDLAFYYGFVTVIVFLALIVVVIAIAHERTAWKIKKLEREKELLSSRLEREDYGKEQELLKTEIDTASKKQLAKFESLSEKIIEKYKEGLEELKNRNLNLLQRKSKDIEKDTLKEVEGFHETIKEETFNSQKKVHERITADYEQARKEIEEYKKTQLKKVDDSIYSVLGYVAESVIGQTIEPKKHEELVLEALDKAKQGLLKEV